MDVAVTLKDVLANARKALVAGLAAGVAAIVPLGFAALADGKIDAPEVTGLVTAFVGFSGAAAYATYKTGNKPLTGSVQSSTETESGALPDASLDDESLLDDESEDADTSGIEPVVDAEDDDEPKHLAI